MTLLLLIRHGTNDWVHGRLAGWTPGVHLNDEGRSQASALAERLAFLPIDAIYASPLDRTVETAQAIAGPRAMPLRLVEGLGEVKYGEWQGAELKELYKHELWPGVQFYPSGTRFPGGETLGEAQMRMVATLDGLRAQHPNGIVAVVSHADIIKLAIAFYAGLHMDLFQRLEIMPCSLTAIRFTRMGPRLLAYNHVGGIEYLKPKPEAPPAPEDAAPTGAPEAAATEAVTEVPATEAAMPEAATEAPATEGVPEAAPEPDAATPEATPEAAPGQSNGTAPTAPGEYQITF